MIINRTIKKTLLIFTVAAAAVMLTACGGQKVTIDSLYEANTISKIMDQHTAVYSEIEYFENLNDEVTYTRSNAYTEDQDESPVYVIDSFDAEDSTSSDNFSYCISGQVQYYWDYTSDITANLLTSEYMKELDEYVFVLDKHSFKETTESKKTDGDEIVLISTAKASDVYSDDEIQQINTVCGSDITKVKYVYRVEKGSLLLNSLQTSFVDGDGTEYVFSMETVTYDTILPDTEFADACINPSSPRTVNIIEMGKGDEVTDTYTIAGNMPIDFSCFTNYYSFEIFNDADGKDPFTAEKADENGIYPSVTFYAIYSSSEGSGSSN